MTLAMKGLPKSHARIEPRLAGRMKGLSPSAVREILKAAERPDVLSFAGGLPAPELFPVDAIAQAYAHMFAREGARALQYSITEGNLALRTWIAERMGKRGISARPEELLMTNGSQQGIDLVAGALLEAGDTVVIENPTYLAALQVFAAHEVKLVAVPSDDEGMQVDALEEVLRKQPTKLIYVVPEFQNPKGTTLALERRKKLIALSLQYGVPILEDDPYGELRFRGEHLPPLASLDSSGSVIYLSTFSKTLAPGMRLGWLHAQSNLLKAATILKQSADLHTATLTQAAAATLMETFDLDAHLAKLRSAYGERCDTLFHALEEHMPEGTRWTTPDGGLFLWVKLPKGLRDADVFDSALRRGVAVVPGHPFFVGTRQHGFIRLNFSNCHPEKIKEGARRLGEATQELLEKTQPGSPP